MSLIADYGWSVKVINAYKYLSKIEKNWIKTNQSGENHENSL
jgi:hypothetical protein